jgi:hypothetical protein
VKPQTTIITNDPEQYWQAIQSGADHVELRDCTGRRLMEYYRNGAAMQENKQEGGKHDDD